MCCAFSITQVNRILTKEAILPNFDSSKVNNTKLNPQGVCLQLTQSPRGVFAICPNKNEVGRSLLHGYYT